MINTWNSKNFSRKRKKSARLKWTRPFKINLQPKIFRQIINKNNK